MNQEPQIIEKKEHFSRSIRKLTLLLFLVGMATFLYIKWGDKLNFDYLVQQEMYLKNLQDQSPLLVYVVAFIIYVVITGLSLPGASLLTLVFGWYFGLIPAVILVSFASTTGATIAFLLSRYFLRDYIQNKFENHLHGFNESLKKEGSFYLFILRLIPAIPFFVINIVMGLTPLSARTFWWISQLGMLPGTAVYVYAGSTVPSLEKLKEQGAGGIINIETFIAFAILGLFPLMIKKLLNRKTTN